MKKIKLLFSVLALLTGAGSAIAVNTQPAASSNMFYDWIDWNGDTILWAVTQQQAQTFCAPSINVCLRAKQNVLIYTSGDLPW
jgi:hypothetical protein